MEQEQKPVNDREVKTNAVPLCWKRVVPFELEKAKNNARIRTIKGDPVRIICWDKQGNPKMRIVALINVTTDFTEPVESIAYYDESGKHADDIALLHLCIEEPLNRLTRSVPPKVRSHFCANDNLPA